MRVACLWFERPSPVQSVAENSLRFSPQICVRGQEAVFIEIGKCRKLYSEEGFRARAQVILRRMKLSASIGIGSDIWEALLLAKYQSLTVGVLPLDALIDCADPFHTDLVLQKYISKMIDDFLDLGIKNLSDFKKIHRKELSSRFGLAGLICHQRLHGETQVPWPRWRPVEIIKEKTEFPYFEFYGELEPILFELKKHLDQIFPRLYARGLKAQKIKLQVLCETNSLSSEGARVFDFDFLFPQSQTKGAFNIIKERLNREFQRAPIRTSILGMETLVVETVTGSQGQRNLLHNHDEMNERLESLLGQLVEAHGPDHIFHAQLTEDRRPEKSWQRSRNLDSLQEVSIQDLFPARPTYVLKPEKVEMHEGYVFIRKKPFKVLHFNDSVERISGGWIEKTQDLSSSYDRNYYLIELEGGLTISLFQDPSLQFFLHGYFG
jgi:hypothetical protein